MYSCLVSDDSQTLPTITLNVSVHSCLSCSTVKDTAVSQLSNIVDSLGNTAKLRTYSLSIKL